VLPFALRLPTLCTTWAAKGLNLLQVCRTMLRADTPLLSS
jgi:hypothetical protein